MEDILYVENYLTKRKTKFKYTGRGSNNYDEAKIQQDELEKKTGIEHRVFLNRGRGKENLIYKKVGQ